MTDIDYMINAFNRLAPTYGGLDTETNGLHIIRCKPFLYSFGFHDGVRGFTFTIDFELRPDIADKALRTYYELSKNLECQVIHNATFDMHMSYNLGYQYPHDNITDLQIYIRLGHDAVKKDDGGAPLKLKDYAVRFIDPNAKYHEALLSKEKTKIVSGYTMDLKKRLAHIPLPLEFMRKYNAKSWTKGLLDGFFGNMLNRPSDLPDEVEEIYWEWYNDLPEDVQLNMTGYLVDSKDIPYNMLNRDNLTKYAHFDIIYMLEAHNNLAPVVKVRQQTKILEQENKLIPHLFEAERVGFAINKPYLPEAEKRLREYLIKLRTRFVELAGKSIKPSQHAEVKAALHRLSVPVKSTDKKHLAVVLGRLYDSGDNPQGIEFIETLKELRTLEKWYQTYLMRFIKEAKKYDTIYTQLNQSGAVSGRFTSDFQQFPKKAIKDKDGNQLFHPRRMVKVEGGDYPYIVYIDYSQIELRVQAMLTLLLGDPDTNLCRAYMPLNCRHSELGVYDPYNAEHKSRWKEDWYLIENGELWHPTDVHGATAMAAYPDLEVGSPEFKAARSEVKAVNFGKNYGAGYQAIANMFPFKKKHEIKILDEAYYKAFPGVRTYHTFIEQVARRDGYVVNLFGRRYYGVSGHNGKNYGVQGPAADFLKERYIACFEYKNQNNLKTKININIHDEIIFHFHKDELHLVDEFVKVMQVWDDAPIPIVADKEITYTTWDQKVDLV